MRRRYIMFISAVLGVILLVTAYFALPSIIASVVVPLPQEHQGFLLQAAKRFNIDSCFGAATIKIESNWNPKARSGAGAQGLGQIISGTFRSVAKKYDIDISKGANDPETNINVMMAYHRYNVDLYGANLRNLAVAYNAGGGRVRLPDTTLPLETRSYIRKMSTIYELYATVYPDFCTGPKLGGGPAISGSGVQDFPDFSAPAASPPIDVNQFWKNFIK